jgi:hypothetical protein
LDAIDIQNFMGEVERSFSEISSLSDGKTTTFIGRKSTAWESLVLTIQGSSGGSQTRVTGLPTPCNANC